MTERRSERAAMLDRDGTIIVDTDYTRDPAHVELLPGAAQAIRALAAAGYPSIVMTNQSGIARGLVSLSQYHAVRRRLHELLQAEGAALADTLTCPHHPDFTGPCACRKPGTALYERAATIHELDLARCIYIGDRYRDVAAGIEYGGRVAVVRSARTSAEDLSLVADVGVPIVSSLREAVALLLAPG